MVWYAYAVAAAVPDIGNVGATDDDNDGVDAAVPDDGNDDATDAVVDVDPATDVVGDVAAATVAASIYCNGSNKPVIHTGSLLSSRTAHTVNRAINVYYIII
jgi:hypothetical protein